MMRYLTMVRIVMFQPLSDRYLKSLKCEAKIFFFSIKVQFSKTTDLIF